MTTSAQMLTHRPTPLPGAEPEADRTVWCDDGTTRHMIGRVTRVAFGPATGTWMWSCLWSGGDAGAAQTRADALERIKAAFRTDPATALDNLPPNHMRAM